MIEVSRQDVADLRGVTPATVSRAQLSKTESGNYDLSDSAVWQYVTEPTIERAIEKRLQQMREGYEDNTIDGLEAEKRRAEIEWKKKQSRKLDLQHEVEKKDLIPSDVVALWIGYFASGIRNNLLTLGKRVARGDDELQRRVDRQITKAIQKTLSTAKKQLRKEAQRITEHMEDGEE